MHTLARTAAVLTVAAVAIIGSAATAAAHITTDPTEVARGGYARVSFQVPNESKTAGTTKIELTLPAEYPLTFVQAEPKPGWTDQVVTGKLDKPLKVNNTTITQAVRTVSWTAQPGTRIGPDEFGVFSLLVIALSEDTDQLVVPATQSYDDGSVVKWDQPPTKDGEEPESPAPLVNLTGSATEEGHGHASTEGEAEHEDTASGDVTAAGEDDSARWLGGAGLLLGALALGVAVGVLLRSRRQIRPATTEPAEPPADS